jgi:hypothetical protein
VKLAPNLRGTLWVVLAGWVGSSGCTHNYYYGGVPACGPTGLPVSSQVGQICEVPSGQVVVSGTPSADTGSGSSVVVQAPRQGSTFVTNSQPRVVISQPAYGPSIGQSTSRLKWRRPDPESLATTRVEGALDGGSIRQ